MVVTPDATPNTDKKTSQMVCFIFSGSLTPVAWNRAEIDACFRTTELEPVQRRYIYEN